MTHCDKSHAGQPQHNHTMAWPHVRRVAEDTRPRCHAAIDGIEQGAGSIQAHVLEVDRLVFVVLSVVEHPVHTHTHMRTHTRAHAHTQRLGFKAFAYPCDPFGPEARHKGRAQETAACTPGVKGNGFRS